MYLNPINLKVFRSLLNLVSTENAKFSGTISYCDNRTLAELHNLSDFSILYTRPPKYVRCGYEYDVKSLSLFGVKGLSFFIYFNGKKKDLTK